MPPWRFARLAVLLVPHFFASVSVAGELAATRATPSTALNVYASADGFLFCLRARPGHPPADKAMEVSALAPRGADPPRLLGRERRSAVGGVGLFLPSETVVGHRRVRVDVGSCPADAACERAAFDLALPPPWPLARPERTCS